MCALLKIKIVIKEDTRASSIFFFHYMCAYVYMCVHTCAQSLPTHVTPMDCSPSGSSVHEIFQAEILEQVAISYSKGPF